MTEDKFIKAMDLLTKNDNDSLVNELCDILNYVTSLKNKNEELETPKSCETCKYFMSNHSFRLGRSDYLNGCKVLITQSDFSCSDYEPKPTP